MIRLVSIQLLTKLKVHHAESLSNSPWLPRLFEGVCETHIVLPGLARIGGDPSENYGRLILVHRSSDICLFAWKMIPTVSAGPGSTTGPGPTTGSGSTAGPGSHIYLLYLLECFKYYTCVVVSDGMFWVCIEYMCCVWWDVFICIKYTCCIWWNVLNMHTINLLYLMECFKYA